jgi:hypothetical protein
MNYHYNRLHWTERLNDFLDHIGNTRETIVVCAACGKIEGQHTFDSSCMTWQIRVWKDTVVLNPNTGMVTSATAVQPPDFRWRR